MNLLRWINRPSPLDMAEQAILAHMHERTGLKFANRLLEHNNKNLIAENARLEKRLAPFEARRRGAGGKFISPAAAWDESAKLIRAGGHSAVVEAVS